MSNRHARSVFNYDLFRYDVERYRERWELSQRTMCAAADISPSAYMRFRGGGGTLGLYAVCQLAMLCDLSIDDYVTS